MVSEDQLAFLRSIDTPTVCNLIEIVAPERRGAGYAASHLQCPFPDLPPMVGFAKTATIRARDPVSGPSYMQKRLDYLDYIAAAPRPSIVVIEDMVEPPGYGAFWGEVQTNVHKSLGCLGTVTNGSIRDLAGGRGRLSNACWLDRTITRLCACGRFGTFVTIHSVEIGAAISSTPTGTAPLLYQSKASTQWRRPWTVSRSARQKSSPPPACRARRPRASRPR